MTEKEWRQRNEREERQVQTVQVGRRTWQVRTTWQSRGTRWAQIVRTERRRAGWAEGVWQEGRGQVWGTVVAEVWE